MTRGLSRLAFVLALAIPPSTAHAQATTWKIDPAHTAAQFAVRHMMVSTVRGQFGKTTGTVTWDGKNIATAAVDVVIDASSIDTRVAARDADLRSANFLDVAKYPTIAFTSTKIEPTGPGKARMTGRLMIHGVTRPVVLEVDGPFGPIPSPSGQARYGASATTTISRKDFGLTWNKALETGGVVVGDEVAITIDIEIVGGGK